MYPDVIWVNNLNMLRKLVLVNWSRNKSLKTLARQVVNTGSHRMIEESNKNEFK